MASGLHGRSGPPPDPNALRRERDSGSWVELPSEGRQGPAPAWPLTKAKPRELALWGVEWRRPQAVMWERNGQAVEVAMYVRRLVEAERPNSPIAAGTLVRQMQEALGLSIPGLLRNRWLIVADEVGSRRPPESADREEKARLQAVLGG